MEVLVRRRNHEYDLVIIYNITRSTFHHRHYEMDLISPKIKINVTEVSSLTLSSATYYKIYVDNIKHLVSSLTLSPTKLGQRV